MSDEIQTEILIKKVPLKDRKPGWIYCDDVSKTIQSQAIGLSPREVAERYMATGQINSVRAPQFYDASQIPTGIAGLNLQKQAGDYWASLSPQIQAEFGSLAGLQRAIDDPAQRTHLLELGILSLKNPPAPPVPAPPVAVDPPAKEVPKETPKP